jgi:ribulose-phosphate 3-epimerase
MKKIIPAILTKDLSDLENKLKELQGLTEWVQIDIADGKFVNNTSIKLKKLQKVNLRKKFIFEVHLMVVEPEKYFPLCQKIGAKRVDFHFEAVKNLKATLDETKKFNFENYIAVNPETPIKKIEPYLNDVDGVLILSVKPGFQGGKFIPQTLKKIKRLKKIMPQFKVEIDGGINLENIEMIAQSGADYLVIGSGLFQSKNIKERLKEFKQKISSYA